MDKRTKCGADAGRPHEMDELMEMIWTYREQGNDEISTILATDHVENCEQWISALEKDQLISILDGRVNFTSTGEKEAEQIIRRHRLTERLFADVFAAPTEVWEREACELEHQTVLVDEAVNAICAFLGHPPTCPHGKPIPQGACCVEFKRDLKPFVIPLTKAHISETYKIVFITPKSPKRLDRLAVLGIIPGSEIRIRQKKPSHVIRIGETDVALDQEIVQDIFVKRIS
jgi:DtxR family Mn-dependent transcriptional regulator